MKNLEHQLQCSCIKWFRIQYPQYADLLFAIPNGGKRNLQVAVKLKKEGVLSGVPDLMFANPSQNYHGLFIEMKFGKNNLTENQIYQMELFKQNGYRCEVCYTFEEFEKLINEYLNK